MRARRVTVLLLGAALAAGGAGCGSEAAKPAEKRPRSGRLVDFTKKPPYVNALDQDPRTKDLLLTTNRGFFRISPDGGRLTRVRGVVESGRSSSPVGTFLEVTALPDGRYVGSGHPDDARSGLPQFLGLLESTDQGRTWRVVSRLGDADFHQLRPAHGALYGWDAVLSAVLVTKDDGQTFTEQFTPRGLIIDLAVDPADPDRLVVANDRELFRSTDQGRTWRALARAEGSRLAWPAPDALLRATKDGTISRSKDGGTRWQDVGAVPGEPYRWLARSAGDLLLALSDGTIVGSKDGGATWEDVFRP